MSMRASFVTAFGVCAAAGASPAVAGEFGAAARASTLGLGGEIDYAINDRWNLRAMGHGGSYSDDYTDSGITYDATLHLANAGMVMDYRPFAGSFRLTGGAYWNGIDADGVASGEDEALDIGDRTYVDADGDAHVYADGDFDNSVAPYLGFGWGDRHSQQPGLMLSVDLGVMFAGTPEVDLTADGDATDTATGLVVDLATNPVAQRELQQEEDDINDDIDDYSFYPVLSLGIGYRF